MNAYFLILICGAALAAAVFLVLVSLLVYLNLRKERSANNGKPGDNPISSEEEEIVSTWHILNP